MHVCRSRKGAWIEIAARHAATVANQRRSRKGAWIEMSMRLSLAIRLLVAPVRERGLKSK